MQIGPDVQRFYMNVLPNQTGVPAGGSHQIAVSLLATKISVRTTAEENPTANELPLEQAMHQRAEAMTEVLAEILDRPLTPRYWGLNE